MICRSLHWEWPTGIFQLVMLPAGKYGRSSDIRLRPQSDLSKNGDYWFDCPFEIELEPNVLLFDNVSFSHSRRNQRIFFSFTDDKLKQWVDFVEKKVRKLFSEGGRTVRPYLCSCFHTLKEQSGKVYDCTCAKRVLCFRFGKPRNGQLLDVCGYDFKNNMPTKLQVTGMKNNGKLSVRIYNDKRVFETQHSYYPTFSRLR